MPARRSKRFSSLQTAWPLMGSLHRQPLIVRWNIGPAIGPRAAIQFRRAVTGQLSGVPPKATRRVRLHVSRSVFEQRKRRSTPRSSNRTSSKSSPTSSLRLQPQAKPNRMMARSRKATAVSQGSEHRSSICSTVRGALAPEPSLTERVHFTRNWRNAGVRGDWYPRRRC